MRGNRPGAIPRPGPAGLLLPTGLDYLIYQGRRRGPAGGVVFRDRRVSFGELACATAGLIAWLVKRGIGAGDRVAIMAANEPALVGMFYAVWELGAVGVPVSIRSTAAEMARLLDHARVRAVLCDDARAEVARDAGHASGTAVYVCGPELPFAPRLAVRGPRRPVHRPRGPRPEQLALIAYTSGSTGSPKGVTLTHGNLLWATLACAQARGDTAFGVGASLSALTHVPVLVSHCLCRILLGATTVLFERFDTAALFEAVEQHGITDLPLIGGMVFDVVALGTLPVSVRTTVQKVSVGGAPTPMEAKRALARIFDGAELIEAYGQTESTDGVVMARGTSVLERPGTVGRMNPHVHVAIRCPDGAVAAVGEDGEIVVGGPTVMQGYLRDTPATRATLRDGWLHTGDLGRMDADGYLYLTGRAKDLIITGGENVSPLEIEGVLRTHPDVADVAVIGTPHPKWGEQVTAVVVLSAGRTPDPEMLTAFAAERLAGFKKPRRIEFVAALPRNAHNKVQTHVLKQQFGVS